MAQKDTQTKRINAKRLQKVKDGFTTLKTIEGYAPQRAEFATAKGVILETALNKASEAELAAEKALATARDNSTKAEWDMHNFMQGVAEQIVGQYGSSSNQLQAIGYKKKSEYKKASPKKKSVSE